MSHHTQEQRNKAECVMEFYQRVVIENNFEVAPQYIKEPYIQHNAKVANGLAGLILFAKGLTEKYPGMTYEFKRIFVDGDYVILHSHVITKTGQRGVAVIDMFRLDGDKLAEHWDVIQNIPETTLNGNPMV
jgi:predicted SnoaL-like aldol condensation-catalyzing enzyme